MRAESPSGEDFGGLANELEERFRQPAGDGWSEDAFEELAGRVFRFQFESNATYRAFCERRGVTPLTVRAWSDAPPVPATAFKHLDIVSVDFPPEAVFRTSGTTAGAGARGRHLVARLSLYEAALIGPFREHLLGEACPLRFVSLIPSADDLPDSSLSRMVTAAARELATETHWLVDEAGRLDVDGLTEVAAETAAAGEPVLLLGTALSLLHALGRLRPGSATLATGSRVMETGGFKGVLRTTTREELHRAISAATGVPITSIVNEYGMTELLSQLYEPVLSEGAAAIGWHVPPPWLRVRALDPLSLDPLEDGEEGILAFFDLANVGSVSHVLTQDVGTVLGGRLRLRGRVRGAEPRGCSRAMDELMSSARGSR